MNPPLPGNPRSVTPGIETQTLDELRRMPPAGFWVRIDWMRFTGSETKLIELRHLIKEWFGGNDSKTCGAKYFKGGWAWEPGVQISFDHAAKICMVDVRGERLKLLSGDEQIRLLFEIAKLGMKPTRIDGAVDWVDQDNRIYENALQSCQLRELCGPRRWSHDPEFTTDGKPLRRLIKLGKRESPVCIRIYDKGLQLQAAGPGRWERIETEWKEDRALQVLSRLYEAGENWPQELSGLIVGAFDFRVRNGRTEKERRPRSQWWECLIHKLQPTRTAPLDREPLFSRWLTAFRTSYGTRIVQIAQALSQEPHVVSAWLLSGVPPCDKECAFLDEVEKAWNECKYV